MNLMTHDVHPDQGSCAVIPSGPLGYPRLRIEHQFNAYVVTHRRRCYAARAPPQMGLPWGTSSSR